MTTVLPCNKYIEKDCCHSGTVLDLPYRFGADEDKMHLESGFNMNSLGVAAGGAVALCVCMDLLGGLLEALDGD